MKYRIVLAKGSQKWILPPLILSLFSVLFQLYYIAIGLFLISLYVIWFFRDPLREIIYDENILYAAADGVIKEITLEENTGKIAIRMSPFDVHLNRTPIDGEITEITYKPGKHTNVYFGGAEEKNEQNLISIKGKSCDVDVLQITGSLARRLECWVRVGHKVKQGDKIGIIRFGSQTNMLITLPHESDLEIVPMVELGQQVHAGVTAIVKLRSSSNE